MSRRRAAPRGRKALQRGTPGVTKRPAREFRAGRSEPGSAQREPRYLTTAFRESVAVFRSGSLDVIVNVPRKGLVPVGGFVNFTLSDWLAFRARLKLRDAASMV